MQTLTTVFQAIWGVTLTSHCHAFEYRSCGTSYLLVWHLYQLSSPWRHVAEAQRGGGVPANDDSDSKEKNK